jgi:hypothetical protein
MKSDYRREYLSNGLEFLSEIKSGVLSDENSMLLSNNIYYKRETLRIYQIIDYPDLQMKLTSDLVQCY